MGRQSYYIPIKRVAIDLKKSTMAEVLADTERMVYWGGQAVCEEKEIECSDGRIVVAFDQLERKGAILTYPSAK